ncbi:hypothetical protein EMCG_01594 [[Emmonsia] crescens]|uniref:Aminoglycoside phosphotransferase domain-containing protein n=1 Tax=[Emmonsia] crescens TaxID=73230 RepID=A0A0G2I0H9_9EURO|nr:hypothetical protein EMCG_01594 [Emmonsia crescens UAMH 3008]
MASDPFTPKDGYGQVIYAFFPDMPKIIRLNEHRVLKSAITNPTETEAMEFVAANTTIPVPKVYETRWSDNRADTSQIVMEYIPGQSLDKVWGKLTHNKRMSICHQLRDYLSQLAKLKRTTTPARIESANGGPVTVGLRYPRLGGPFDSEKEFNDFLVGLNDPEYPSPFKQYARSGMKDNHDIHFAHGDFSPRNIMVDESSGEVKAVLDWDRAGWYPEYWDQNRILSENPGLQDYFPYLNHIVPFNYAQEVLALGYLLRVTGDG